MTGEPADQPDSDSDDDGQDDKPQPVPPITTANIAPALLPPNIIR